MFVTFYGVNNIGKTTHSKRFVRRCEEQGLKVKYLKYPIYELEPTGPLINEQIRGINGQTLTEEELQTLYFQNRLDYQHQLINDIENYDIVVAEDYTQTGIGWGTAKGASEEWLESLNSPLIQEDISVLMTGERSKSAIEEQHVHENSDELINKCAKVLENRADKSGWIKIPVQSAKEDTENLIWENLWPKINKLLN